jgi:hypothetical protein
MEFDRRQLFQRASDVLVAVGGLAIGGAGGAILERAENRDEVVARIAEEYPPPLKAQRLEAEKTLQKYSGKSPEELTPQQRAEVERAVKINDRQDIFITNSNREMQAIDRKNKRDVVFVYGGLLVVGIAKVLDTLAKRKAKE